MPSKSQRRHLSRSKQKGKQRGSLAIATQQQTVTQTYKPAPPPKALVSSVSAPAPMAIQTVTRYPYILTELRRIGILAGIMLAILVVLALVLS